MCCHYTTAAKFTPTRRFPVYSAFATNAIDPIELHSFMTTFTPKWSQVVMTFARCGHHVRRFRFFCGKICARKGRFGGVIAANISAPLHLARACSLLTPIEKQQRKCASWAGYRGFWPDVEFSHAPSVPVPSPIFSTVCTGSITPHKTATDTFGSLSNTCGPSRGCQRTRLPAPSPDPKRAADALTFCFAVGAYLIPALRRTPRGTRCESSGPFPHRPPPPDVYSSPDCVYWNLQLGSPHSGVKPSKGPKAAPAPDLVITHEEVTSGHQ